MKPTDYLTKNKLLWNKRTKHHLSSQFYDVEAFIKGKSTLNSIELTLLGDIKGLRILHLQCHFGLDSLSLSRMGAKVTGVDFSDAAISEAQKLNTKLALDADFICCDIYSLPEHLNGSFDIVFTSYGTIGWLPDVNAWATIVSHFLKPKGKFIFVDFHPFVWMYDADFENLQYNYFNTEAIIETEIGSYASPDAEIKEESIGWNHPTSEVLTALINNGLSILSFEEYDYSPYSCFRGMKEIEAGKFRITKTGNKIPLVFSLEARKKEE